MSRSLAVAITLLFGLATACGGDKSTTEPDQTTNLVTNGTFKATINGTSWSAANRVVVNKGATNIVAIAAASPTYFFNFALTPLTGPGSFSLAFGNTTSGSQVTAGTTSGQGWSTVGQGSTGSVVITSYTSTRIAGTFSFDAAALPGLASGVLHVTNGSFDITY
jgi:hypothetical protein